jgi:hypothetical protein
MKTVKSWSRLALMSAAVVMASIVMSSCSRNGSAEGPLNDTRVWNIGGSANGSQMVPAVQGNGNATISGTFNPANNMLNYTVNWNNLSGGPTMGGFYNGAAGSTGTLSGSRWTLGTGLTGTGTYSGSMMLDANQASQLTSGGWYYSLGTANNMNGEVRGQITATR